MYCVFHLELIKSKYKKGAFESVYYTVFDPIYPTKTSHSFSSGAVWEHKIAIVPQEHDSSPCNSFFSLFFTLLSKMMLPYVLLYLSSRCCELTKLKNAEV